MPREAACLHLMGAERGARDHQEKGDGQEEGPTRFRRAKCGGTAYHSSDPHRSSGEVRRAISQVVERG
jgi:hypothetical protein